MTAPAKATIAASNEVAREAAQQMLKDGGNALDAALAGYFALCGATPWALLAPMAIGMGGGGAGSQFVDGRTRQPGRSVPRPVRTDRGEDANATMLISAPGSVAAVAAVVALYARRTLVQIAANGIALAKSHKAKARTKLVTRVAQATTLALQERGFLEELERIAPRIEGRLLQADDLSTVTPTLSQGRSASIGDGHSVHLLPWQSTEILNSEKHTKNPAIKVHNAILVGDGKGMVAGVALHHSETVQMFDGEIEIPQMAHPILRGVPKVKAGTPIEVPLSLALLIEGERPVGIVAGNSPESFRLDTLRHAFEAIKPHPPWERHELPKDAETLMVAY